MDINEIIIGAGQIGSSVILGGMALMYSHRVYNIEKNRDVQISKDRLIGLILELVKENQEYFMKRSNLKNKVVDSNRNLIYSNTIWNRLNSENFDFYSKDFKNQIENSFNKVNEQKYEDISVPGTHVLEEFLEDHKLHVTNLILFCERIYLQNYSEDINLSLRELLKSMSNESNEYIEYDSPEQIFYYYGITSRITSATDQVIRKLNKLLSEKS